MKKIFSAGLVAGSAAALLAFQSPYDRSQEPPPRLVVLLAIDQLPDYLLDRCDSVFTGGFRRLLDEGFRFTQATHDHAITETAPGHAALSTGVHPSRHGIVENSWREQVGEEWRSVYAVEDSLSPILGSSQLPGRSPTNLLVDALGDWMQAADRASQILSVSRKDRAAITLAGRSRDAHVYWLVPSAKRWVTSTYYRQAYSRWFESFHQDVLPRIPADSVWESSIPEGLEVLSRQDTASYEADGVHTYFPHRFLEEGDTDSPQGHAAWLSGTPWVDEATLALAEHGVRSLELGRDRVPDLLAISLSQADIIGHSFGPMSREQFDNLLRLDRALGEFLAFLDREVGAGRWVLGFSADHGVLPTPEYLQELGEPGRRTTREDISALLDAVRQAAASGGGGADLSARVKRAVEEIDWIAAAYTIRDVAAGETADSFGRLFQSSYVAGRPAGFLGNLGVMLRPESHVLISTSGQGTSHGSPYWYDRHVPMIFLGAGVRPGSSSEAVSTIDMAPTLAALAGIAAPDDLDGSSILP